MRDRGSKNILRMINRNLNHESKRGRYEGEKGSTVSKLERNNTLKVKTKRPLDFGN